MQKKKYGRTVNGATYTMQGEIFPSWDSLLMNEEPHDGNVNDWAFNQEGRVIVDEEARVIKCKISDNKSHACDQNRNPNKKS